MALYYVDGEPVIIPKVVFDAAKLEVRVDTDVWQLHYATENISINWKLLADCDKSAVLALKIHVISLIERRSPKYAHNTFNMVAPYLQYAALRPKDDVRSTNVLLGYYEKLLGERLGYKFNHVRKWYGDSVDRLFDGFIEETAYLLDDLRIGGNEKGQAVMSADQEAGPLSQFEEIALRSALLRDRGPIEERVATWLELAYGLNPANFALLREGDFISLEFPGDLPTEFFLNIPRIKKRKPSRTEFTRRPVDPHLAALIQELIARNKEIDSSDDIRPLFRLKNERRKIASGPLADYKHHPTGIALTQLVQACVRRLGVHSHRTGKMLKVTSRRLRYTFACKMVREGKSPIELATLLDHTDTQNVMVYYDSDLTFVDRLDAKIAEQIAPFAKAFMGQVSTENQKSIDLIPYRDLPALGVCGASFVCSLAPHRSCYPCTEFQPSKDGPHEEVRAELLAERDQLLQAGNDRAAEQLTVPILAATEVILQIRELENVRKA